MRAGDYPPQVLLMCCKLACCTLRDRILHFLCLSTLLGGGGSLTDTYIGENWDFVHRMPPQKPDWWCFFFLYLIYGHMNSISEPGHPADTPSLTSHPSPPVSLTPAPSMERCPLPSLLGNIPQRNIPAEEVLGMRLT